MDNNQAVCGSSSDPPPPWIELPRDVMENILRRLGPEEILENAQIVCTTWRSVCNEPSLWRVIDMKNSGNDVICRRAVDLSQGELIDISIDYFCSDELLNYISELSSCLKCLRLGCCNSMSSEGLTTAVKGFPELEELHLLFVPFITAKDIEEIGISCPKLKSFKFINCSYKFAINNRMYRLAPVELEDDSCAFSIARNMQNLQHLCLLYNKLSNEGLKAILDGCPNLESLDLRKCFSVDLQADLGKICLERIKYLKCPFDKIDDYEWNDMPYDRVDYESDDTIYDHGYYWNENFDYQSVGDYEDSDDYDPDPFCDFND